MHDELRSAVLAYTSNPAYRAAKPAVIAERLGLVGDAATELKKTIKKMVRAEELEFGPKHLVLPIDPDHPSRQNLVPNSKAKNAGGDQKRSRAGKYVVGTFRRVSSGDGFVRPEGAPASAGKDQDVYVSAKNSGDAANGDTVRLVLSSRSGPRGKSEGKLVDIVERSTNRFVGTYFESAGMGMVRVDGKVFGEPIYVGDPGAKGAKQDDKVVIEMVRFPSQVRDGEGVITEILGGRGAPGVDTMAIKYEFSLPGDFPEDVLEDSRAQAEAFDEDQLAEDRRDLREEVVVTIDPLPDSSMTGSAARTVAIGPRALTAKIRSTSAAPVSWIGTIRAYPALFTSTSRRPKRTTVSATIRAALATSETSAASNSTAGPSPSPSRVSARAASRRPARASA